MVDQGNPSAFETPSPQPTGSMLVLMARGARTANVMRRLESVSGIKVAASRDYRDKSGALAKALHDNECTYLESLNVAVLRPRDAGATAALSRSLAAEKDVLEVRPEFYMFAIDTLEQRYQRWVRDGLRILAEAAPGSVRTSVPGGAGPAAIEDSSDATWGIKAVKADRSSFTGRGIRIAVLDTGFDLDHPDFADRTITTESFVPNEPVNDVQGHGTHCIGSSAGPDAGAEHPRYGVAPEAEIFVGKVLGNNGSGRESWILAGMEWAIQNGCQVISMSLGRGTQRGEPPDPLYESVGQDALDSGALIIAAPGNESARRFGFIAPVGAPANSPSIMAVAAVDSDFQVADFSSGGINDEGGEINIAGPGVQVLSSFPMPRRYRRLAGTSMATPHVAGIAALYAQSDPALRGRALWEALRRNALDIGLPPQGWRRGSCPSARYRRQGLSIDPSETTAGCARPNRRRKTVRCSPVGQGIDALSVARHLVMVASQRREMNGKCERFNPGG